jgi:uncharacterized delta-60 repeat protein
VVVGATAWCVGVGAAVGAPGDLDTSFSTDGKLTTAIGTGNDNGYPVAVDSAGRVVVAGYSNTGTYDFAVAQYTSAGELDTSFSTDGKLTTDIGTGSNRDKLYGGKGRDVLVGGPRKDRLYGGPRKDTAKKPGPGFLNSIEIIVP